MELIGKMSMSNSEIEIQENEQFISDDLEQQPPDDIIAYNELRSCADLYRMHNQRVLNISPDFQRESVWKPAEQTRFIDSLIKQLPIPSMCFSLDYKTQKWQVIDGLQRMTTIIKFLDAEDWTLSNLVDIDKRLAGNNASKFKNPDFPDNILYQRLENLTLPITVLRCDYSKNDHMEYLFTIFHRLNTGGTKLNNQEIRNCIFGGTFNQLLKSLNKNDDWKRVNQIEEETGQRFKYEEMILRFFAFNDELNLYKGKLSPFLNEYMRKNREPNPKFIDECTILFNETIRIVSEKVIQESSERLGISTLEALMIGVSKNIEYVKTIPKNKVKSMFGQLRKHESLSSAFLRDGIGSKSKVDYRMKASIGIFSGN